MIGNILFFILAIISIAAGILMVTRRSPVASALYLILIMCCLACFFVLLNAIFLATLQVIVYAGAVMVLFIFVIMLLNLRKDEYGSDPKYIQKYLGAALVILVLAQAVSIIFISFKSIAPVNVSTSPITNYSGPGDSLYDYSTPLVVAETLFTRFSYPFEVTSILLLTAIIGAVVIAKKTRPADTDDRS